MSALITCHRCEARYTPGDWWAVRPLGRGDTTGNVHWLHPIDPNHCPICRQPPQLEPKPQRGMAM